MADKYRHAVEIQHVNGESTVYQYADRQRAIELAYLKSRTLTVRESVSACGFVFRGVCPVPTEQLFPKLKHIYCTIHSRSYIGFCQECQ